MNTQLLNQWKQRTVWVLMGGPGPEHEVSLTSGLAVAQALRALGAQVHEETISGTEVHFFERPDLVFNLIHGTFGEDGQLQELLEDLQIPYTGENALASRLAFDKIESKLAFESAGVPVPEWEVLEGSQLPTFPLPYVLKPPRQGSAFGVHIIKDPSELSAALADCHRYDDQVLVERYISGRELTVGILGSQALPIIEIIPRSGVNDYNSKYMKGQATFLCPAPLSEEVTQKVQEISLNAAQALDLQVYSRMDLMLDPQGQVFVFEANTLPGMTETSLLPQAASVMGVSFPELCAWIGELSLQAQVPKYSVYHEISELT